MTSKFHRAYVEITNICGLACSFCPPKESPTQTMELLFFKQVLKELKPYTDEVALHVMGDPMVLSNLGEYLDCAHVSGFKVMITTSGFYLDEQRRFALFHPSIRQVNISLNSFNKNSVARSFETYMEPILALCDEKLSRKGDFFINLRLWNLDEVHSESHFNGQLFALLEERFSLESGMIASNISGERQSIRLASKILLHFDRYFEWPSLKNEVVGDGYCHGLSKQIAILADGRVVPCCLDGEGIMTLGNLHVTNLGKILSTKRSCDMMDGFSHGKCSEELCQKCSYKERFKKEVLP
ncbi:MAG: radical SAM protein [Sulfuricurvum sp.]|uniref:radical SAM/SPASM domain-containing protein n=1 Tax=Sulfuricurvum sp. TaxID=2025608 RepID=UPI00260B3ABB|nr:radical SAM protein [Sulfuricurvum sp.]MDD2827953.1 radical SAM protein [Sulfuricurvum sp.]MDD4948170.1 radical SAM protein [Sulfuricurvum sp.]